MKYKLLNGIDNSTYALVFDPGDEVMETLATFANEHSLKAARFTAIGAFSTGIECQPVPSFYLSPARFRRSLSSKRNCAVNGRIFGLRLRGPDS